MAIRRSTRRVRGPLAVGSTERPAGSTRRRSTTEGCAGKVVLVDFWTYTCINWLRTLGYVRAWHERYADQGLVVIGVHTPEFPFERDEDNVRRAARTMNVEYPVALDPDYAVWDAFANHYWPARLHRRRGGARSAITSSARAATTSASGCIQGLLRRRSAGRSVSVAPSRLRGPGGLGEPGLARDVPRRRAGPEPRASAASACASNQWALDGGLDDRRQRRSSARPRRGAASRSASTPATSTS